ncbi:hypothetical protein [Streptomyces sp. NPDC002082]|uniref:hypothetical protein n=1 Tax=Streptomyces sp. NPDC002082 TaxID=3154772 RepID=UPI00331E4B01
MPPSSRAAARPDRRGGKIPGEAELHAAAFDPATGALLWSGPLGARTAVHWSTKAEFVSADPLVVAVTDHESSVTASVLGAYYSFGGNCRPNPPIDFSGSYGEIGPGTRFTPAADDSRLYVVPRHRVRISRFEDRLAAFDLATGQPVWGGSRDDDRLEGDSGDQFLLQDGKLTVLAFDKGGARLHVLDPATGDQRDVRDLPDGLGFADEVFAYGTRLVVARHGAYSKPYKPFTAYER